MTGAKKIRLKSFFALAAFAAACVALCFLNLYPNPRESVGQKSPARVLSVDNSNIEELGLLKKGYQILHAEILSGPRKGEVFEAHNVLRAQMDLDKMFEAGDTAWVSILDGARPEADAINAQDFYRRGAAFWLFAIFAFLLVLYGGFVGCKALMSFVFCCIVVWKLVIPLCLLGYSAILVSLCAVCFLTAVIIFLVAGFTRKGATAFCGAMSGVVASCLMAWLFARLFSINGAVMPFSQALLYSGFENLSLSDLYIGGIFLSASGAVMDLSMDVAAGMQEVYFHNNAISRRALISSGMSIGRSVVGTMATTLLFAYAGGYLTLMMVFLAQGTSPDDFINNPYVASECVKTIVGSFGLVLVAPLTAAIGG
ncbi:MAG: YibE/F family protein, partial [Opitutales bacterium]|nr:YibE/F family protein [Opitutales bacterium]